jgi:hypothetical protein
MNLKFMIVTLPFPVTYIRPICNLILTFNANLLLGYLVHKGVEWIVVDQDTVERATLVKVINLLVPQKAGNFFTN